MKLGLLRPYALLALFALGGCASTDESTPEWAGVKNEDEPARLAELAETARFAVRWQSRVGDSCANLLQPALTEDAIYTVSAKGVLMRLDRITGKPVWRF